MIKKAFTSILLVSGISIMCFYVITIPPVLFITMSFILSLIYALKYSIRKNSAISLQLCLYLVASFIAYYFINIEAITQFKSMLDSMITFSANLSMFVLWSFIFIVILLVSFMVSEVTYSQRETISNEPESDKELYIEREKDLERLKALLEKYNIVGINGPWGSGKSFITDQLQGSYILLKIDLLACNIDNIQEVILYELDKVLTHSRIFSLNSPQLRKFFGKDTWLDRIANIFLGNATLYSKIITDLQKDLQQVDKEIIIIFEDIDRINNIEAIKKILCISEKIANNRIKVIYQYHVGNLDKIGFTMDYLEKYIPVYMNITEISFRSVLSAVLKEHNIPKDKLNSDDFIFLFKYLPSETDLRNSELYTPIDTKLNSITIRRMMQFIDEINVAFDTNLFKKHKKKVIGYFFIKHFVPDLYNKLIVGTPLLYTFLFNYQNKKYTIIEIMNLLKDDPEIDLKSIFNDKDNTLSTFIIFLLDYSTYSNHEDSTLSKKQLILHSKHENEKTNRLIWKLMANGKSEYTDAEIYINSFYNMVLYQNPQDWKKNFIEYSQIGYKDDPFHKMTRDNSNIQHIGESYLLALSKNIPLVELSAQDHLLF